MKTQGLPSTKGLWLVLVVALACHGTFNAQSAIGGLLHCRRMPDKSSREIQLVPEKIALQIHVGTKGDKPGTLTFCFKTTDGGGATISAPIKADRYPQPSTGTRQWAKVLECRGSSESWDLFIPLEDLAGLTREGACVNLNFGTDASKGAPQYYRLCHRSLWHGEQLYVWYILDLSSDCGELPPSTAHALKNAP